MLSRFIFCNLFYIRASNRQRVSSPENKRIYHKTINTMKKTLRISLYGLLLLSSCNSTPTGYTVEGSIDDSTYNGKTIYIKRFDDQKIIDSTRIENNRFSFCGEIDTAVFCRIDISLDKYVSFYSRKRTYLGRCPPPLRNRFFTERCKE